MQLNNANIKWLEQFGIFVNSYEGSTLFFKGDSDDQTGTLNFDVTADIYYALNGNILGSKGNGVNQNLSGMKSVQFKLNDSSYIPPKTDIQTIFESPEIDDIATFLSSIKNTDGTWNLTELSKYVSGSNTIPTLASIEDISYIGEPGSKVNLPFVIKVSGWWNGENFKMEPAKTIKFTTNNEMIGPVFPPEEVGKISDPFQWWWIVMAVGGAVFTGLVIWFSIKKSIY